MLQVRHAVVSDFSKIFSLYKKVAERIVGIARTADEISEAYVQNFMQHASQTGVELVIANPENPGQIIAEIHSYKLNPRVFSHVLSELTIVVDPDFQGQGAGKLLFNVLLAFITDNRPDILRVELIARESNVKAIEIYKKLGFKIEGRMENRIKNSKGFEADIPMGWFNPRYQTNL